MNMNTIYDLANSYIKEAAGDNTPLAILDKYYNQVHGENYPNRNPEDKELRTEILKAAETVGFESTIDDFKKKTDSAKQWLKNNYQKAEKVEKEQPSEKPTSPTSKLVDQNVKDVDPKKWPTYEEFRRKYYKQLVDLGWPGNISNPDYKDAEVNGGLVYPWSKNGKSAYVFNKRGKGLVSFRNYTQKIKTYLYNKFERDQKGLEALSRKVDSILEVENQFLKKKKILNIMGTLLLNIFRGLGASSSDENVLKWLGSKIEGMTIFEYMKFILDEMITKMAVSDDSATVLKNILYPLNKIVKDKCSEFYDISKVELEYDHYDKSYESFFKVKVKPGNKDSKHNKAYSPFVYILENVVIPIIDGKLIASKSGRNLKSSMTIDEINKLIKDLLSSSDKEISTIFDKSDDVVFSYDALDPENNKKVIGVYQIEFKYFNKGCEIRVSFSSKKAG